MHTLKQFGGLFSCILLAPFPEILVLALDVTQKIFVIKKERMYAPVCEKELDKPALIVIY